MIWYAVIYSDDYEWDTGSFNKERAIAMAEEMGATEIAIVDDGIDPTCIGTLVKDGDCWEVRR